MQKVTFLNRSEIKENLMGFSVKASEFHWAIAWGSKGQHLDILRSNIKKVRRLSVGISFHQTDPEVIDALINCNGARVVTKIETGVFHPKVYGFKSGKQAFALVGSANFTNGGFLKNEEAAVAVVGKVDEPFFTDLFSYTDKCFETGDRITKGLAEAYRFQHTIEKQNRRIKPNPKIPRGISPSTGTPAIHGLTWGSFEKKIRNQGKHDLGYSLKLCLLYTSPSPRDATLSRMPSSA